MGGEPHCDATGLDHPGSETSGSSIPDCPGKAGELATCRLS